MVKRRETGFLMEPDPKFHAFMDAAPDAIVVVNREGLIVMINGLTEKMFGYGRDELIGRSVETLIPDRSKSAHLGFRGEYTANPKTRPMGAGRLLSGRKKDGTEIPVEISLSPLETEQGTLVISIIRDITEAFEQSEERFKLLIDSIKDYSIIMLDPNGRVASWNDGAERIHGYEQKEILGKQISLFYTSEDREMRKPELELETVKREGRFEDEGWRVKKDGTKFWASVLVTSVLDAQGKLRGFSKVTRDTSERKRILDELKEAVRSRDEFLSIASHELKTPLTSLYLHLQMMKKTHGQVFDAEEPSSSATRDQWLKNLDVCEHQTQRLAKLIEELLDLTRIRLGKMSLHREDVDLTAMVQNIVLQATAGPGPKPRIDVRSEGPVVGQWDTARLEQVVTNLLNNAIKYGEGQPVEMTVSTDPEVKFAHLTVKDGGMGIAPAMQKKIFERFERGIGFYNISGLGLGLYICRQIVDAHGGIIQVESEVAKGAKFTVTLPLRPR